MAMHDGRAGPGRLERRRRDLLRGDRHMRILADGVTGAGEGAGDDDVVVHGLMLSLIHICRCRRGI